MGKHLQSFILTEIERGVFIHSLRLSMTQILYHHVERLLIILHELWL